MKDRNEQMVAYWIKEPVVDRLTGKGVTVFFKGGKLCSKKFSHYKWGICVVYSFQIGNSLATMKMENLR